MDRIGSNPSFNPSALYQQNKTQQTPPPAKNEVNAASAAGGLDSKGGRDFSSVFDDDELAKLQGNLERIASLAERALKRIDG